MVKETWVRYTNYRVGKVHKDQIAVGYYVHGDEKKNLHCIIKIGNDIGKKLKLKIGERVELFTSSNDQYKWKLVKCALAGYALQKEENNPDIMRLQFKWTDPQIIGRIPATFVDFEVVENELFINGKTF